MCRTDLEEKEKRNQTKKKKEKERNKEAARSHFISTVHGRGRLRLGLGGQLDDALSRRHVDFWVQLLPLGAARGLFDFLDVHLGRLALLAVRILVQRLVLGIRSRDVEVGRDGIDHLVEESRVLQHRLQGS